MDETNKKISIEGTSTRYQLKKLIQKKEKKPRQITKTWDINEEEKQYAYQLNILNELLNVSKDSYISMSMSVISNNHKLAISHLKAKLSGYRHQDILKKRIEEDKLINYEQLLELLVKYKLKCNYCSGELLLLYEFVREGKQWTLDRIDNDIGHNYGNVLVSCLECNLKRRVVNKDKFFLSQNMIISREGL